MSETIKGKPEIFMDFEIRKLKLGEVPKLEGVFKFIGEKKIDESKGLAPGLLSVAPDAVLSYFKFLSHTVKPSILRICPWKMYLQYLRR